MGIESIRLVSEPVQHLSVQCISDGHIKQLGLQAVIVLLKGSAEASHKSAQGLPHLPCPAGGEGHPARKHHGLVELVHGRCPWRASG